MTSAPCQVCDGEATLLVVLDPERNITLPVCAQCRDDLSPSVRMLTAPLPTGSRP